VKLVGQSPAVLKAQGAILRRLSASASEAESEQLEIEIGSFIKIGSPPNLSTYQVESISQTGIVRCIDPTDDDEPYVELPLAEANELFNKYIRY
jgi:hypothetical protein